MPVFWPHSFNPSDERGEGGTEDESSDEDKTMQTKPDLQA
jgi:hypothetical protein